MFWNKIKLFTLVAALGLHACAATPPPTTDQTGEPVDLFDLQIRVGRMDVMVDQSLKALGILIPDDFSLSRALRDAPVSDDEAEQLYSELKKVVEDFRVVQSLVCWSKSLDDYGLCGETFDPTTMDLTADQTPSRARLKTSVEEVEDAVMPYWSQLCGAAVAKSGDQYLCAIE